MTNNLKILVILSIFVFILTGYFCFSSSFTKNQIITNNNDEENNKTTGINNEDSNKKDNREKTSKLSILKIIIIVILIIIIIIGVIVFIIVNKFKFEFNEESKEDFAKENFCPTFFLISVLANEKNIIGNFKENGDYFFEILAKYILSRNAISGSKNINEVEISLTNDYNDYIDNDTYFIYLDTILYEISNFAAFSKVVSNEKVDEIAGSYSEGINIDKLHTTSKYIENKYGGEFDSYLCSYLLYHLAKEIKNKKKVKIHNYKTGICNHKKTYNASFVDDYDNVLTKEYNVDFKIMDKILEKLFKDKPLENMEYEYS